MKISELLVILTTALRDHGDLEVFKVCGDKELPITKAVIDVGKPVPIRL